MTSSQAIALVRAPADLELALRCVDGDRSAQQELFQLYRKRAHATLFRMLGANHSHMDDLLQEAFLNIFRSLRLFRGESSLATWVDRCTVRVAYAYFGEKKRSIAPPSEISDEHQCGAPNAEDRAVDRQATARLYDLLEKMDAEQRVAFTLFALEDRSLKEIAELTSSSLEATKTRVWRARRMIAERARKDPLLKSFVPKDDDAGADEESQ